MHCAGALKEPHVARRDDGRSDRRKGREMFDSQEFKTSKSSGKKRVFFREDV